MIELPYMEIGAASRVTLPDKIYAQFFFNFFLSPNIQISGICSFWDINNKVSEPWNSLAIEHIF